MKTKKPFKVVREWGIKPKAWGIVSDIEDKWYLRDLTSHDLAQLIAMRMNDAFELGKETEWKESQAKAEKLMERFGI